VEVCRAQFVAGAKRPLIAQELVEIQRERSFPIPQLFRVLENSATCGANGSSRGAHGQSNTPRTRRALDSRSSPRAAEISAGAKSLLALHAQVSNARLRPGRRLTLG